MTRSGPPNALGAVLSRKVRLVRQSKDRPCNTEPSQLKFAHWHKSRRAMAGGEAQVSITRLTGLWRKASVSKVSNDALLTSTPTPGFHRNAWPIICGCSVSTNNPKRHTGMPQPMRRAQSSATTSRVLDAGRAPSVNHSTTSSLPFILDYARSSKSEHYGACWRSMTASRTIRQNALHTTHAAHGSAEEHPT